MMKIFKGKERGEVELKRRVADKAATAPDFEQWYLFKFFDMNTNRWSPVYAAFSYSAMNDEMVELTKKQPKRAFYMKGLGTIGGGEFLPDESRAVYIGEQYEDIG